MAASGSLEPMVLVVMGVSGSGKSTVGALLAERLSWPFADGDDFHSASQIDKMHAGQALGDDDRRPWLAMVRAWIDARLAQGEGGVIVCSALKRSYRALLGSERPGVRVVYLEGGRDLIAERLRARRGHFMPASLLESQFAALEPPGRDEDAIVVGIDVAPDDIAATIAAAVGFVEG